MSFKPFWILIIFILATSVLVIEARGGRGRGGSFGTTFYRRSHKKHSSSGGTSSRRKVVSGSPVHTSYTKALISGHSADLKLGGDHKSHVSHSSTSSHNRHPYRDTSHTNYHSFSHFYTQQQNYNKQPRPSSYGLSAAHFNTLGANSHISHTWRGHQLPPGHVYITQPFSVPSNAVYYAQPPRYRSTGDDAADFALGYLVGRSLTHRSHHQHYYQEPQLSSDHTSIHNTNTEFSFENNTNTSNDSVLSSNNSSTTNQTLYWPTDNAVSLAPLNKSLLPENITSSPSEIIFKSPPTHIARPLKVDNLTFELPTATAAPPDMPLTGGIICMPWLFNEIDPINPKHIVNVEKIVCFPAPSPPPPPSPQPTPQSSTHPVAGDIAVRILQ